MTITVRPVRAIKQAAHYNIPRVLSAMQGCGMECFNRIAHHKHVSIDRLLTGLPKPTLERILANVRGAA